MNNMSTSITWTRTILFLCTGRYEHYRSVARVADPGRRPDGAGLDELRPARSGPVGRHVPSDWRGGHRVAAPGLGRGDLADRRPAAVLDLRAPHPARGRRAGRGDGRGDDAVHGGRGPAAARHGPRAG